MKKTIAFILALTFTLLLSSCTSKIGESEMKSRIEDFSFSLTWNCYGDSTYDSKTGNLVKQKVATHVEDYTTTYFFTDQQKAQIYDLVVDMKPESYPDEYNPLKGTSKPSRNIVLTVTYNGITKTITCNNVSLEDTPNGVKGQKFMKVHDTIVNIITNSNEWLALPDYEFSYD